MERQPDSVLLHMQKTVDEKGYADIGAEMRKLDGKKWENDYGSYAQVYFFMLKSDKYEGFIKDDDKVYVVFSNKNYSLNQSVIQTNNSVRNVNKMFIATIVIAVGSLIASLFGVGLQMKQLSLQRQQLQQKPVPQKLEISQPVQVDFPSRDTVFVKTVK